jgi:hypothetical protein
MATPNKILSSEDRVRMGLAPSNTSRNALIYAHREQASI